MCKKVSLLKKIEILFGEEILIFLLSHNISSPQNISANPNLQIENIKKHANLKWDYMQLSQNPNLTIDFILSNLSLSWDWYKISKNPNISYKNIMDHINLPWTSTVFSRPNLKYEECINYYHLLTETGVTGYSQNLSLDILKNNRLPFCYIGLSGNPTLTIDFIRENKGYRWYWDIISYNTFITEEIVETNMDLPWCWCILSYNKNIFPDFIEKHILQDWNWEFISANPNLTLDFVKKYILKKWNWKAISKNPNITLENIESNLHLPWDWNNISGNPNLTFDFIMKYIKLGYNFNWIEISHNSFLKQKELFLIQGYKEFIAINKIQKWWLQTKYSPYTPYGKKFINSMYDKSYPTNNYKSL